MTIKPGTREAAAEYQCLEAEWTYNEMQDFVRLIQRYRGTYVTAIFVSVGWMLGQMLGVGTPGAASGAQPAPLRPDTLDELRSS